MLPGFFDKLRMDLDWNRSTDVFCRHTFIAGTLARFTYYGVHTGFRGRDRGGPKSGHAITPSSCFALLLVAHAMEPTGLAYNLASVDNFRTPTTSSIIEVVH